MHRPCAKRVNDARSFFWVNQHVGSKKLSFSLARHNNYVYAFSTCLFVSNYSKPYPGEKIEKEKVS
jgi:hypothetical protein